MKRAIPIQNRLLATIIGFGLWTAFFSSSQAQEAPYERKFPQSKAAVEEAVQELQTSTAGPLPLLDGFAAAGDHPLDRFHRGYYQYRVSVSSLPSGGSLVRVSAKITAWYADAVAAKSGYRELPSNGRLESDFLDRLTDALTKASSPALAAPASGTSTKRTTSPDIAAPTISAPMPHSSLSGDPLNSPGHVWTSLKAPITTTGEPTASHTVNAEQPSGELARQAKSLEEILRNQSHPNNLAAVKKAGTPVLASPSEGAKVMFLASAEDEYEILDTNASWVHVRISGLSRGWILRSSVEMPEASPAETVPPETDPASQTATTAAAHFQIENEQIASFPADWEPLRGRTVKIVSIQKAGGNAGDTGAQAKLAFAKSLLDKEYVELARSSSTAAGVVLIFDSSDGGMLAATMPVLEQWKEGSLSDEALWRRCYFDPPELHGPASQ